MVRDYCTRFQNRFNTARPKSVVIGTDVTNATVSICYICSKRAVLDAVNVG